MDGEGEIENSYPLKEAAGHVPLKEKFPLEELEFENGKIAVREMEPSKPRVNGDIPLLTLVGWGMNQKGLGQTERELYLRGQHTITIDFEGSGSGVEGHYGSSKEINRQAKILSEYILSRPEEKVNILGQSMSTLTILSMLVNRPEVREKVGKVLFFSPMGLGGEDNLFSLIKRNIAEGNRNNRTEKTDLQKEQDAEVMKMLGKFLLKNPVRAYSEGKAMANADEYETLKKIKEEFGINAAIIQGDLDVLNSNERVWKKIGEGSKSPFKVLTQEDYEKDREEYDKRNLKPGDKVWDREVENETPPASIAMTSGGHEAYAKSSISRKILRVLDSMGDN